MIRLVALTTSLAVCLACGDNTSGDGDAVDTLGVVDTSDSSRDPLKLDLVVVSDFSPEAAPLSSRVAAMNLDLSELDVQVVVLSADFGAGREVSGCSADGYEARPVVRANLAQPGCTMDDVAEVHSSWDDARCTVALTGTCRVEQPLAVIERFVTTTTLLRADARLGLVVHVRDGDCSAIDPARFFDPDGEDSLDVRCATRGGELISPEVVAHSLTRAIPADEIALFIIGGVPVDSLSTPVEELAGRLIPEVVGTEVRPTCETVTARAFPPHRLLRFVTELSGRGAAVVLGSACAEDLQPQADLFNERLVDR